MNCESTHDSPRPAHAKVSWGTQGQSHFLCKECIAEVWRMTEPLAKAALPGGYFLIEPLPFLSENSNGDRNHS